MPASKLQVAAGILGGLLGVTAIIVIGTRDNNGNIIEGELQPDGKTRCVNRNFNCTAYTPEASDFRPDAGPPYVNLILAGQECLQDDGGTYFNVPQPTGEVVFEPMLCTVKAGIVAEGPTPTDAIGTDPNTCACRGFVPDAGNVGRCFLALPDGGQGDLAPYGETLFPGRFTGRDCVLKACGEIAGISSWPTQLCPTGLNPDGGPKEVEP